MEEQTSARMEVDVINKYVVSKGLCITHGGAKKCEHEGGCVKHVLSKGLCFEHGGGKKCKDGSGCSKQRQVKELCRTHSREKAEATQGVEV